MILKTKKAIRLVTEAYIHYCYNREANKIEVQGNGITVTEMNEVRYLLNRINELDGSPLATLLTLLIDSENGLKCEI